MEQPQTAENQRQTIPLRQAPPKASLSKFFPIIVILIVISAGIFSGLILSSRTKSAKQAPIVSKDQKDLPQEVKQSFSQTFKDEAEGIIEKNDQKDKYAQGTHKLIRSGGDSQTAYLTSTVLDLDSYVGKKVKVYGETFGSKQVGWLMDVGKVEEIK